MFCLQSIVHIAVLWHSCLARQYALPATQLALLLRLCSVNKLHLNWFNFLRKALFFVMVYVIQGYLFFMDNTDAIAFILPNHEFM